MSKNIHKLANFRLTVADWHCLFALMDILYGDMLKTGWQRRMSPCPKRRRPSATSVVSE
ncbi:hypothetical protein [uncultured Bacteroides sp.]|uniref:hypothetical protein n=1 Tax=uncultured Bacteroides sp. TaxID=162156 RepID=UPI0025E85DBE|nr:hypothetical protein [uncultured Bacteroides sp.]